MIKKKKSIHLSAQMHAVITSAESGSYYPGFVQLKEKATVTDEPVYWKLPSSISKVQPEFGHRSILYLQQTNTDLWTDKLMVRPTIVQHREHVWPEQHHHHQKSWQYSTGKSA